MIRTTPKNKLHKRTPYYRVQVPPEIVEQFDRIAMEHTLRPISETSGATIDRPRQQTMQDDVTRGTQEISPECQQGPPWRDPSTGNSAGSNLNRADLVTESPDTFNGFVRLADSDADEAIEKAANLIATESENSIRQPSPGSSRTPTTTTFWPGEVDIVPVEPPTSGVSSLYPGADRASSSNQASVSAHSVTCKANVDVDQLRRDLREVFDEFIMRANAVVDRHIERL